MQPDSSIVVVDEGRVHRGPFPPQQVLPSLLQLRAQIEQLDDASFFVTYSAIHDLLSAEARARNARKATEIRRGMTVRLVRADGMFVEGAVTKVNRSTVDFITSDGRRHRADALLLVVIRS